MANFAVTTGSVTVSEDGVLSLREAIALAQGTPEDDLIFFNSSVPTITLDAALGPLALNFGLESGGVEILGDQDGDGRGDVTIEGNGSSHFLIVGGDITLTGLVLNNGTSTGSSGARGIPGFNQLENSGMDGGNAGAGFDGGTATGSIFNAANLTLNNVVISNATATGGAGGTGSTGGAGAEGVPGVFVVGGDGLDGGNGGTGGDGGDGGSAASAILNAATGILSLNNVAIVNASATAGAAGIGGTGSTGGAGGRGADGGDFPQMRSLPMAAMGPTAATEGWAAARATPAPRPRPS